MHCSHGRPGRARAASRDRELILPVRILPRRRRSAIPSVTGSRTRGLPAGAAHAALADGIPDHGPVPSRPRTGAQAVLHSGPLSRGHGNGVRNSFRARSGLRPSGVELLSRGQPGNTHIRARLQPTAPPLPHAHRALWARRAATRGTHSRTFSHPPRLLSVLGIRRTPATWSPFLGVPQTRPRYA